MDLNIWHLLLFVALLFPFSASRDGLRFSLRVRCARMLRVWLVLATASLVTQVYQSVPVYIVLDLVAAALVLAQPRCAWQKAIGLIMLTMATMSIGFMIAEVMHLQNFSSVKPDERALWQVYVWLSWAELAIFYVWGGHDWLDRFVHHHTGHRIGGLASYDGRS